MRFYSPLRYPGGKGNLYSFFQSLIKKNDLLHGTYVEPFAGGAAVAFELLKNDLVEKVIINDIDKSIYAFWHSVLYNTEELIKLIENKSINMDEWYKQKEIQKKIDSNNLLELGFSTFFLNRTNRSGIINGGVIGGKKQEGNWKLNARYNKDELINRINLIADLKDRIKVYNMDAIKLIQEILPYIKSKKLVYLDPPYFKKGPGLYINYFQKEDHYKLASVVKENLKNNWIVSYDDVPDVTKLYKDYLKINYYLNYSAAQKHKGREVMFFSKNLKIPDETEDKVKFKMDIIS